VVVVEAEVEEEAAVAVQLEEVKLTKQHANLKIIQAFVAEAAVDFGVVEVEVEAVQAMVIWKVEEEVMAVSDAVVAEGEVVEVLAAEVHHAVVAVRPVVAEEEVVKE
jgi:hypothetical protein